MQKVILVVEHNANVRDTITHLLRRGGYLVLTAADGATAMDLARQNPISLMIVDPESLQPDWPDLCHQLRSCNETYHMPILMMANSQMEIAQLVRLNLGVNDFIAKPFLWEELRACVRALLRGDRRRVRQKRVAASPKKVTIYARGEVLVADTLRIDLGQRRVIRGEQQIHFGSPLLFHVLVYLVRHRGDVLTRDQLLKQVWCREGVQDTRTVDVHVHWLRQKLHDDPVATAANVGLASIGSSLMT